MIPGNYTGLFEVPLLMTWEIAGIYLLHSNLQ